VQPANVDETPHPGERPREYAERLAAEKAQAVGRMNREEIVLGADTIVVVEEMILGKPRDADDAFRMLRLLSGREHRVITGVCLVRAGGENAAERSASALKITSETTLVTMTEIGDEEIRAYIATGEPMDKAGAYAIQGIASRWIPRIEGDYSNVVGLPVALVYRMLREMGW
jgi:septum formation protein